MVACWKENGTVHVGPGGREEHSSLNKCYLLNCTEVRFSITVLAVRVAKVNIEKDLLHEWPRSSKLVLSRQKQFSGCLHQQRHQHPPILLFCPQIILDSKRSLNNRNHDDDDHDAYRRMGPTPSGWTISALLNMQHNWNGRTGRTGWCVCVCVCVCACTLYLFLDLEYIDIITMDNDHHCLIIFIIINQGATCGTHIVPAGGGSTRHN